jgi:hypothetical protein
MGEVVQLREPPTSSDEARRTVRETILQLRLLAFFSTDETQSKVALRLAERLSKVVPLLKDET